MTSLSPSYKRFCDARKDAQQHRVLRGGRALPCGRVERGGRSLINFASNDYLGLAHHPALIDAMMETAEQEGVGATASRYVCGNHPLYEEIEKKIAAQNGTEAALIFSSGYQANSAALAALAAPDVIGKDAVILADRLCHNSLLQGALHSGTRLQRFHHNDIAHLETLLKDHAGKPAVIVSESVFSMDGDRAGVAALKKLSVQHDALLYIDEAHGSGIFPSHPGIDVVMGTFGKALGVFGAYIACDAALRDYLVQQCAGLIYSAALPPPVLGAINAVLDLLPYLDKEREHLLHQAARLRTVLLTQGWELVPGDTQIIALVLGDEGAAMRLSDELQEEGFFVPAIRPPTVPRGTSRLRISLSAAHSDGDIDGFIEVMKKKLR